MRALTVRRCGGSVVFCRSLREHRCRTGQRCHGEQRDDGTIERKRRRGRGGELLLEDFAIASDNRGFHRGYRGWSVASSPAFGSRGIFRRLIACRIFLADAKRTIGIGSLEIR